MPEQPKQSTFRDISIESTLAEIELNEILKKPGDICSYQHLREKLNKDPQREARGYVATARRRFERKHNCVLAPIKNEGIKWLTPKEIVVTKWDHDARHLRSHSRSMLGRQKTTIGEAEKDLTPELLKQRNQNLAFAGTIAYMAKPKTERLIANIADQNGKILSATEALEHFKKTP